MWRGWRVFSPQIPFTRRLPCNRLGARARSAVTLPPPPPITAVVRIVAGRTASSATNASRKLSIGTTKRKGGDRDRQERWRPGGKRGARGGGEAVGGRVSKGGSSGLWMKRHLKDPYVSAATESGAPSRAAYKLVEINDKHGILAPGDRVVDLGAAPGGWSMVASRVALAPGVGHGRTAASGRYRRSDSSRRGGSGAGSGSPPSLPPPLPVDGGGGGGGKEQGLGEMGAVVVAVDLLEMEPLLGVQAVRGDFRDVSVQVEIFARLAGEPFTSPGSPRSSGTDGETAPPDPSGMQTSADDAGNNRSSASSGAFLLRGTSSSEQLLPRPTEPSVDSLESLLRHGAGNPSSNPKTTSSGAGAELASAGRNSSDAASWALGAKVGSEAAEDGGGLTTAFGARGCLRRANVVLSDMAPSFTGDRDTDQGRAAGLVLDALAACVGDEGARRRRSTSTSGWRAEGFDEGRDTEENTEEDHGGEIDDHTGGGVERPGPGLLARGGTFLGKFFAGRDEREVKLEASRLFRKVRMVKPPASRTRSSEMYVLATGFLLD